jgi:cellulose synthase/poly-beta-1,6-N-acetylglucosamine synthase-like glycosyltransferase
LRWAAEYLRYLPLGILGLVRWLSWLIRRIPATLYRPMTTGHREGLSIVVPVYQEDPKIFMKAIDSWLANSVERIILVIDITDTACQEVAEVYADDRVETILTEVPGKRAALRLGWEQARTPLVALVDSDTIWAPDVAERVSEPFADPGIGGVGTRQSVHNPRSLWQKINDMYLDYRYFDENAAQTVMGQAVSCLSGRTAVYRRDLLLQMGDDFLTETFMGVPCMSGDDKRLTSLLLEAGYRTYMQRSARVWSTFPTEARIFFRQRLRWARNTWRSDLRALGRGWVWKRHRFLAFSMLDKAVSSFTLLVSPAVMVIALVNRDLRFAGILALWWLVSRSAKMLPHLQRRPRSIFLIPLFVLLSFVMCLVKIWALCTIREQRWLTREVEVIDGSVVRTAEFAT